MDGRLEVLPGLSSHTGSEIGFSKTQNQLLTVHSVRTAFYVAILAISVVFQISQGQFINIDVWMPVYLTLMCVFLLNAGYLFFFENLFLYRSISGALFAVDAVVVTALIYFTGINQSIFLFLYLVNIILGSLVFQKKGGVLLALWTSILFSFLLVIAPSVQGQNLYFSVGLNNLAFFSVAWLSGILGEQINFMGVELEARDRDLEILKDFNAMIINNISAGLITIDLHGLIIQGNPAASEILEDGSFKNKTLNDFFPELYQAVITGEIRKNSEPSKRYELKYTTPRGDKILVGCVISPLFDSSGTLNGYVMTFDDITQIKRMENNMRQQEKMAAVGQLAAGIAHEIRNPLASISGSVQLMVSDPDSHSTEDIRLMKIVLKEIDRLNKLITEFLDFVRPDVYVEDPINLNSLCSEIMDMVRFNKELREDVKQDVQLNAKQAIFGNRDKLKQAILNIVMNSYQAMDGTQEPHLLLKTFDDEERVCLTIEDSGVGMSEVNLQRMFEPFHTTKSKGTGLGLAVTHKILENHRAEIHVESELGEGTKITIYFPGDGEPDPREMEMKLQA